jgi:hypothetical protein
MYWLAFLASIMFAIPEQYQGSATVIVHFVDFKTIDAVCGKAALPNHQTLGCFKDGSLWVYNSCYADEVDKDSYARLMCHEKAHVLGWVHGPSD